MEACLGGVRSVGLIKRHQRQLALGIAHHRKRVDRRLWTESRTFKQCYKLPGYQLDITQIKQTCIIAKFKRQSSRALQRTDAYFTWLRTRVALLKRKGDATCSIESRLFSKIKAKGIEERGRERVSFMG